MRPQLLLLLICLFWWSKSGADRLTCSKISPEDHVDTLKAMTSTTNNVRTKAEMQSMRILGIQWGEMLSPAPRAIALFSALTLITKDRDVSLENNQGPQTGYQYIKWPGSLRATLDHLSETAYEALFAAHYNMREIQLTTAAGSEHFDTIRSTVRQPVDSVDFKVYLPTALKRLEEIAPKCVKLATEICDKFNNTVGYIAEVIQSCKNAASFNEKAKKDAQFAIESKRKIDEIYDSRIKKEEAQLAKRAELYEVAKKAVFERIANAPTAEDYRANEPMDRLPCMASAGSSAMAQFNPLSAAINFVGDFFGGIFGRKRSTSSTASSEEKDVVRKVALLSAINRETLFSYYEFPYSLIEDIQEQNKEVNVTITKGKKHFKNARKEIEKFVEQESPMAKNVEKVAKTMISLTDRVLILLEELEKCTETGRTSEELKEKAQKWQGDVLDFQMDFNGKISTDNNMDQVIGPEEIYNTNGKSSSDSPVGNLGLDYRLTVSVAKFALEKEHEIYMEHMMKLNADQDAQLKNLKELMSVKFEELDLSEAIAVLAKALHRLEEIREHWKKLAWFFSEIQLHIKSVYHNQIIDFVGNYRGTVELNDNFRKVEYSSSLLYAQCFKTAVTNYRLHLMAATYTKVSSDHFLLPLQTLHSITKMATEDRQKAVATIYGKLESAQESVRDALKNEYHQTTYQLEQYRNKVRESLKVLCPTTNEDFLDDNVNDAKKKADENNVEPLDPYGSVLM